MAKGKKSVTHLVLAALVLAAAGLGVWHFTKPVPVVKQAAAAVAPNAPVLAPEDKVHAGYAGSESCRKLPEVPRG